MSQGANLGFLNKKNLAGRLFVYFDLKLKIKINGKDKIQAVQAKRL